MVEATIPLDSTWPDTQSLLQRHLAHLPAATIDLICWGNARGSSATRFLWPSSAIPTLFEHERHFSARGLKWPSWPM